MPTIINKLIKKLFAAVLIIPALIEVQFVTAQVVPTTDHTAPAPSSVSNAYKPSSYPSNQAVNYIRTWSPKLPYTNEYDFLNPGASVNQVGVTTDYMDGFGRPIEMVEWKASPGQKDVVHARVYDALGREQYSFLPYTSPSSSGVIKQDPFGEQSVFYGTTYPTEQPAFLNEKLYYSQTEYESSPLNRATGSYLPGNSWVGSSRKSTTQYLLNNANDQVQLWNITMVALTYASDDISTNIPTSTGVYAQGQLSKIVIKDENGSQIITFSDKDGHIVLKKVQSGTVSDGNPYTGWLCTYYVYDDLGKLRFVIPPKAVAAMVSAASWSLTTDIISELCFRYEYDSRLRTIAQKMPGAGWVYMVYDQKDRLVYSQDANMRLNNQWLGTIYDNLDRVVETGMLNYSGNAPALQTYVNNNTGKFIVAGQAVNGTTNPGLVALDLDVTTRETGKTLYTAYSSITFEPGVESEDNAAFETQLTQSPGSVATSVTIVNDNTLPSGYTFVPLTYSYYDNYAFTSKTYNTANNTKLDQGNNIYADAVPSSASAFTKGMATGSKVRVIENSNDLTQGGWLEFVSFYDDRGRLIQTQADNYKGGIDYKTNRYNFAGNVVCSYLVHNNPAAGIANFSVKTNANYDHEGRLVSVKKTLNDDDAKARLLVYNVYDAMGKLKTRKLGQKTDPTGIPVPINDPANDNTDWLENDNYAYNIQGWLKGINWDYTTGPTISQVNYQNNKWFGMDLSYDWGFNNASAQFNGNISGQRWVSAGDKKERAYGYSYDMLNRLLKADFTQNFGGGTSPNWTTSDPNSSFKIDFSVQLGDAQNPAYDPNGNIKVMKQWGLQLNTSKAIDDLLYSYENINEVSNKLRGVTDRAGAANNNLGDFTDNNASADDFGYDLNGNTITSLDKRIGSNIGIGAGQTNNNGIVYNYLNLPWQVSINNAAHSAQGTITYIYDATGNRLEKRINEPAGYNNAAKATTLTYIGGFVYSNNQLQYFPHEYGKVRPRSSNTQPYVYDYFLKDHLGNTRMVLTDEQQQDPYPVATLENNADALAIEQSIYYINTTNIVDNTAIPGFTDANGNTLPANVYYNNNGNPPYNNNNKANTSAQSAKMYKLNGAAGDKTGLGVALKVMTGDQVNIWGRSYYHTNSTSPNNTYAINATTAALNSFLSSFAGTQPLLAKGIAGSALSASPVTPPDVNKWLNSVPMPSGTTMPKAYINWILFDEQFRPVTSNCGFDPVSTSTDQLKFHQQTVPITQSGYLYVYCSNESDINVYFDNLQVILNRGPELEETHYYPFGLSMAGISAKAYNKPENLFKYNGKELEHNEFSDGTGLEAYDYGARYYDPQIGRWSVIDPDASHSRRWSPYSYAYNNPVRFIDPDGMDGTDPYEALWRSAGISQDNQGNVSFDPGSDLARGYDEVLTKTAAFVGGIGAGIFAEEAMAGLFGAAARATEAGASIEEINEYGTEGAMQRAEARGGGGGGYGAIDPGFTPLSNAGAPAPFSESSAAFMDAGGFPQMAAMNAGGNPMAAMANAIGDATPGSLAGTGNVSALGEAEPATNAYNHVGQFVDDLYASGELGEDAILYRGDARDPNSIFSEGFTSKGDNDDIMAHIEGGLADSYYIPTTKSYNVADIYTPKDGWSYLIDNPGNGFDIYTGGKFKGHQNAWEKEVSFGGSISNQNIIGAYQPSNPMLFVPNPEYRGTLDAFFDKF